MSYPIEVAVRDHNNTYSCRFPNGIRASSTNSAQVAVERLMDKVWNPGTHRAIQIDRIRDITYFHITPIEVEGMRMSPQTSQTDVSWQRDIDLAFLADMLQRLDSGDTTHVRTMIVDWISDLEREGSDGQA